MQRYPFFFNRFAYIFVRTNWLRIPCTGYSQNQNRFMTTSKRVQDRSKLKRIHDLEIVKEKWKVAYKVLFLMEILMEEPEMIIPVRSLSHYRKQISLPKPHKISDFIQKSPKLFELYKDRQNVLWCGMTKLAEDLVEEKQRITAENEDKAAEYVTRCLMMSIDKRLPLYKIANFRRDFGMPVDFRARWVNKYPHLFKVMKDADEQEYLELVSWNPSWAITELEKKVMGITETSAHTPGLLSLSFPMKFPSKYRVSRYRGKIEHFQKLSYLSPYADARGLQSGSKEFDKRAIAVMHELLSFTIEKRLVTDHLTHFRREMVMPQKLMRLLLKHFGIFYVSERGKRFSVFLTEAYNRSELIDKGPFVLWKEKVLSLCGYRGKKKKIECFSDMSDMEDNVFHDSNSEKGSTYMQLEKAGNLDIFDNSELDIGEVCSEYQDIEAHLAIDLQ